MTEAEVHGNPAYKGRVEKLSKRGPRRRRQLLAAAHARRTRAELGSQAALAQLRALPAEAAALQSRLRAVYSTSLDDLPDDEDALDNDEERRQLRRLRPLQAELRRVRARVACLNCGSEGMLRSSVAVQQAVNAALRQDMESVAKARQDAEHVSRGGTQVVMSGSPDSPRNTISSQRRSGAIVLTSCRGTTKHCMMS